MLGLPNGSRNLPNYQHTIYILSVVKTELQNYCDTSYTRSGVNQVCILKNSNDLLEYIQSRSLSFCNSIKTFDYSNPTQLFPTLSGCWSNCVSYKRNTQRRYKYLVVVRDIFYFVNNHSDSTKKVL